MDFRKLRPMGGGESLGLTIPKDALREDDLIDDRGRVPEGHYARVERIAEGSYRIDLVDF